MADNGKIKVLISAGTSVRDLELELDMTVEELVIMVEALYAEEADLLDLVSTQGNRVLIPRSQLAFIQMIPVKNSSIGFGF